MFLKLNTAVSVKMGAFVAVADGVTPLSSLTPVVRISKNGGAWSNRNSATAITYDEAGFYNIPLSAIDTNTLGALVLMVSNPTVHYPVRLDLQVLTVTDIAITAQEVWAYEERRLTSGVAPSVSSIDPDTFNVTIVRGDDYVDVPLEFTQMDDPGLGDLIFKIGDPNQEAYWTVDDCAYAASVITVELPSTVTSLLTRVSYSYTLEVDNAGDRRTLALGKLTVKGKVLDAP